MKLANYSRGLGYATLLTSVAVGAAGCATRGHVNRLEDELSKVTRAVNDRIGRVETIALSEGPIMLTQRDHPVEFGMLFRQVLNNYNNLEARKIAEREANALTIVPTVDPKWYWIVVMHDGNTSGQYSDGKPTTGEDRTYPDGDLVGHYLRAEQIPAQVNDWLMHVRSAGQK